MSLVLCFLAGFWSLAVFLRGRGRSNFYDQKDVWSPLMMQRPLLMDPVNPFSNIVDPQDFDPRELTSFASTTHFFWSVARGLAVKSRAWLAEATFPCPPRSLLGFERGLCAGECLVCVPFLVGSAAASKP